MIGKMMREGACLAILGLVGIGLATAPAAPGTGRTGGAKLTGMTKAVFAKVDWIASTKLETKISKTAKSIDRVFDKLNDDKVDTKVDSKIDFAVSTVVQRLSGQVKAATRTATKLAR